MRAALQQALTGPDALTIADVPIPGAGHSQVLIDVRAASVVFPDLLQTRGLYQLKPAPPYVPGGVAAGTVRHDSGPFTEGDRVVALTGQGAWADVVAAPAAMTLPLPAKLSFADAAAMLVNYGTMYFALVRRGRLSAGETVLVHGAAGGIGTATLDLARILGARTIAVVSSPEKAAIAKAAGASEVIALDGFRDEVMSLTNGTGVDVVVDPVGGDRFTDSLRSLAPEGRVLVVGFATGDIPTVKVNRLLLNNNSVEGVGWGAFWTARPDYLQQEWAELMGILEDAAPYIGGSYALEGAADALRAIEHRRATGTLILAIR